nr:hypothetical protein [Tanacetum cinerariifolium]
MEDDVDINTLTIEQYLAWVQDDIRPGVVKPKISNDIEFEINSNFMRELRRKLFKGPALRWINRLSAGLVTTWDLLEKAFIRQYCPHFKTTKKLEIIRNFKQEIDETLYYDWERTHETICAIGIPEEIKEDKRDMNDGCDITVEDVERLRRILTPPIHALPNLKPIAQPYMPLGLVSNKAKVIKEEEQDYDIPLHEHVMQPLTPQKVRITPPDNDYVASATNPILNKHLNEFEEEFADNTRISKKIDSNPVNNLKELLKT